MWVLRTIHCPLPQKEHQKLRVKFSECILVSGVFGIMAAIKLQLRQKKAEILTSLADHSEQSYKLRHVAQCVHLQNKSFTQSAIAKIRHYFGFETRQPLKKL